MNIEGESCGSGHLPRGTEENTDKPESG